MKTVFIVGFFCVLLSLVPKGKSQEGVYKLQLKASGQDFFDYFFFYTRHDQYCCSGGYVNYVDYQTAVVNQYVQLQGDNVYIGCDHDTVVANGSYGRDSVRIHSKQGFNGGLFVLDVDHMPAGCANWPGWWLVGNNGDDWPYSGEIDIIEGVNLNTSVSTTLHTSDDCGMADDLYNDFTGEWAKGKNNTNSTNCSINATTEYNFQGCSIIGNKNSFGAPFNSGSGGAYVFEWTPEFMRMFFFPRGYIPPDLNNGEPNPNGWGKPYAYFQLGSNCPNNHFVNQTIIINNNFCGDWAGGIFTEGCPGLGTCESFVQNNPAAFKESYWLIRYMAVYQYQTLFK